MKLAERMTMCKCGMTEENARLKEEAQEYQLALQQYIEAGASRIYEANKKTKELEEKLEMVEADFQDYIDKTRNL